MRELLNALYNLIAPIFDTSHYQSRLYKYRANVIYAVTMIMFIFWLLYAFGAPDWEIAGEDTAYTMAEIALSGNLTLQNSAPAIVFYSVFLLTGIIFFATRRRMLLVSTWGPFVMWYTTGVLLLITATASPGEPSSAIVFLMLLGAMFTGGWGIIAGLALSLMALFIHASTGVYDNSGAGVSLGTIIPQLIAGAIVLQLFLRFARLFRQEGAEEATESRQRTATVVAEIAETVAMRGSLNELLDNIVSRVIANFDRVYHAQIFLTNDDNTTAMLTASTGEVGQQLIARAHALQVGSHSVIGQVTLHGNPIIARAGSRDSIHRENELLPDTAVEAAFALRIGGQIIGALDLQSKSANAFDDDYLISTFSALADSTALAIDNVSQFQAAQARLQENARLVEQERETAREVERLNERLTGLAWMDYFRNKPEHFGVQLDIIEDELLDTNSWTPTLTEAATVNTFVQKTDDGKQFIALPLRVRGQVIGAMEFELDENRAITPEDYEMLQEVSERFGLAAENARLVDESRRVAQREALVNQISTRLQTTNKVEEAMTEAARGLREAFKAERVAIRLGTPEKTTASDGGA